MFKKIILFITACAYIDFYGFIDTETFLHLRNFFKVYDIFLILLGSLMILEFLRKEKLFRLCIKNPSAIISLEVIAFIVLVALTSKLRYDASFFSVLKIARYYLSWTICLYAIYIIVESQSVQFIRRLVLFSGTIMSIIYMLITIFPQLFVPLLRGSQFVIYSDSGITFNRLYTTGFLFPTAALCILVVDLSFSAKTAQLAATFLLIINSIGCILQGFRVYIISTIISVLIGVVIIIKIKNRFSYKGFKKIVLILFLISLGLASYKFSEGFVVNRIMNGVSDFINEEGTYKGRISENWFRRVLLNENPLWGIGFVDAGSKIGQQMGLDVNTEYSAYSTDSGYLTLTVTFGAVGIAIYLFLLLRITLRQIILLGHITYYDQLYSISAILFIVVLAISNITHAGLSSPYGIVPLSLLIAIPEGANTYLIGIINAPE